MKKILTLLFVAMSFAGFSQQFGEIHGVVEDNTGMTLPGATVVAFTDSKEVFATTDIDGRFKLKPLAPGTWSIKVTYIGKHDFQMQGIPVYADDVNVMKNVTLEDASIDIGITKIYAYKDPLIRKDGVSKAVIRAADIKHNPQRRNIQGMVSTISPVAYVNPATQELHFKGSRGGSVVYLVDGVKVTGEFRGLPTAGIGSMSVYTGGIPAKYGDTTGGVIVIETKNYFDVYNERMNQ